MTARNLFGNTEETIGEKSKIDKGLSKIKNKIKILELYQLLVAGSKDKN